MLNSSPWQRWRMPLVVFLALTTAFLLLYRESMASMVALWMGSENYAHAIVVPPIALWLAWRRRQVLQACAPKSAPAFLLPLLATVLVWAVGDLSSTNAVVHFSVVMSLVLLVPTVLGIQVARAVAFPLGFLFFAVPFGEFLFPMMMEATATFTVAALRATGIPVYREGMHFVIPSGHWSVIEACSGLRYLTASTMVGALFGHLNFATLRGRLTFFLASILTPLLANWVRAYMIVMIGHLSGNTLAVGVDHLIYGWVFFGIVMLLLFVVGGRFADAPAEENFPVPAAVPGRQGARATLAAGLSALLVLALPHLGIAWLSQHENRSAPVLASIPAAASAWQAAAETGAEFEPQWLAPAAVWRQIYATRTGEHVGIYIGYYRQQSTKSKLISSENYLVRSGDKHWTQVRHGSASVEVGGMPLVVQETELRGAGALEAARRLMVWQLYWANGHWTASDATAKLYGAAERLRGKGDDGARLIFYTELTSGAHAQELLAGFVRDNLSLIERQLRMARGDLSASK